MTKNSKYILGVLFNFTSTIVLGTVVPVVTFLFYVAFKIGPGPDMDIFIWIVPLCLGILVPTVSVILVSLVIAKNLVLQQKIIYVILNIFVMIIGLFAASQLLTILIR